MKEGVTAFDQEYNFKVLILIFGINICEVWSLAHHFGKHLTSLVFKVQLNK